VRHHRLVREQHLPQSPEEAFEFFGDALNLEAITPPWLKFRVTTPAPIEMRAGTLIDYRLRLHGMPVRWHTRIEVWQPGRRFVDRQLKGPYRAWHHTHEFEADGAGGTIMRDVVRYALPLGALGALAHLLFVRRDVERIFDHRRDAIARLAPDGCTSLSKVRVT
jgi:ligand-binding SRPBCC domain-containing protein